MSSLVRLALRFRAVTLLLVVLFAGGGTYSVVSLNQELFPSLEVPYLVVAATQPGAGPEAVDRQVSQPLETAVRGTGDVVSVTSTSREGVSLVTAEFDFGTDMVAREQQVRDAIGSAGLPENVGRPTVQRLSPDSFPIYSLAVFGADEKVLQRYLDDVLAPAVRDVSGVGEVTTAGGNASVVAVVADPAKLAAAGLSSADVTTALQAANLSTPVGGVVADGAQLPVRVVTGTDSLDSVKALPLAGRAGGPAVPLSSVAAVSVVDQGVGTLLSRTDGEPSISLEVVKKQDANTVSVVDGVEQALADNPPPRGSRPPR